MDNQEKKFQSMINDLINNGETQKAHRYQQARESSPKRTKELITQIVDLMDTSKEPDVEMAYMWTALTILLAKLSETAGVPRENVMEAIDEAYKLVSDEE